MIARSTGLARSTVSDYLDRAAAAGLGWPLPPTLTDAALEALLFALGEATLDVSGTFAGEAIRGAEQIDGAGAAAADGDGEGRLVTAMLRPGKRPSGQEIRAFVRRLVGAIRALWPKVEILLRADSHYASPEVFDWCRTNRVDWVFGLALNAALCRQVAALEKSTAERFKAAPTHGKRRRFAQFYDAAQSWSRVERIIASRPDPREPIPASL